MAMNKLPRTFCWTKMGTEAGQELASIVRRKEWERQLGGGLFFWGIGQSLGRNAEVAAGEVPALHVVFSPMPSTPKAIDVNPAEVVMWTAWVDAFGKCRPLPIHSLVTSRASLPSGRKKTNHYALVCASELALDAQPEVCVFPNHLRNITTDKPLGASQVTAVVRVTPSADVSETAKRYPVSFTAELQFPYFVRLVRPVALCANELEEIRQISGSGNSKSWLLLVKRLYSRITLEGPPQQTLNLLDTERLEDGPFDRCSEKSSFGHDASLRMFGGA